MLAHGGAVWREAKSAALPFDLLLVEAVELVTPVLALTIDPARVVTVATTPPALALTFASPTGVATIETLPTSLALTLAGSGPPEDPGVPEGTPQPQVGDTVRLDTRASLQAATTFAQAIAAVNGADNTGERTGGVGSWGWSFSTNFDGQGTRALVANLVKKVNGQDGNTDGDQGIMFINYLAAPKPKRLYVQWRSRLGKHPSDPTANGTNNDFPMYPESNSLKRLLVPRAGVGGGDFNRWDYVWTRHNPTQLRSQIDHQNWSAENSVGSGAWSAHDHVAETILTTVYFQAASSDAVADGIIRVWIGGELTFERTNVPAQTQAFDRVQLPTVYHDVPRPCAEYLWDFLMWEPA